LSNVLKVGDSSHDDSEEDFDGYELAFISRKICKIWRSKGVPKWKNSSRRIPKEKKDKDKSSIICYECKNLGHFKSECLELEKGQDKKKHYKTKEKKGLISILEYLDETSSNEQDEEANICLMTNITSKEFESN